MKLITLLIIIASFGCSNQKNVDPVFDYESYESINDSLELQYRDSIYDEINILIPKMELICNERGHIYEYCETELSRLKDKRYRSYVISSRRIWSSLDDIGFSSKTLIDYDNYSVLETKTIKSKECYRCGDIKENITVRFDTIYTTYGIIKNINTLNK